MAHSGEFDPKAVMDAVIEAFMARHTDEIVSAYLRGEPDIDGFVVRLLDGEINVEAVSLRTPT